MLIKNKRTHALRNVSQDDYAKIIAHPQLRSLFIVVDSSDMVNTIIKKDEKVIIPEEILNFRKLKSVKPKRKKKDE